VVSLFRGHYNIPLIHAMRGDVSVAPETCQRSRTEAQDHRRFIDVFDKESHKVGGAEFLAREALSRRDRKRLGHRRSVVTIKSHHNVGGLPTT